MSYECCRECGGRTGAPGPTDDSLYLGNDGPYCRECYIDATEYVGLWHVREAVPGLGFDGHRT